MTRRAPSRRLPAAVALLTGAAALALGSPAVAAALPSAARPATSPIAGLAAARDSAPVIMTGAEIPGWSRSAATGAAAPYPSGAATTGDGVRSAHNGTLVVPPDSRTGVDVSKVAAYSWTGSAWKEIPVQVDQRFLSFLANGHSSFSTYSGTDQELTYAWAPDAHDTGEEAWKKDFGQCSARYASSEAEVAAAEAAGVVSPEPAGSLDTAGYEGAMQDPVPTFDDDDELSFMASDTGAQAPAGQAAPAGTSDGQAVRVTDPLDPTATRFAYLFLQPGGSRFTAGNGYVHMTRDRNADEWIDRYSYGADSPDRIGTSNTGYGPNLTGTVCRTASDNNGNIAVGDGTPRASTDRDPRDGMTITTPTYTAHAIGRWLVKELRVTAPGTTAQYGPNIIARWKGRAFQQTPDSSVSVVGFEDEQVNWEQNSAELGWRAGPIRAIREIWGADSGTNVTKTELWYRDADVFNYHVRVHPIPTDGLYTDWDYRPGVATTYYNAFATGGVPIDGVNDSHIGEVDQVPVTGQNVSVNSCDPTYTLCSALDNPEEVAGDGFGLVYDFELTSPSATAGNAAVVPYYRDDACFDDGTGDAPITRANPGERSDDPKTQAEYIGEWQAYWDSHPEVKHFTRPASYSDLLCQPGKVMGGSPTSSENTLPPWQLMPFQGAIGEHGIHFFTTQDSDNTFTPLMTDEIDGQQWRFEIPMAHPTNDTQAYGTNVSAKLVGLGTPYDAAASTEPTASLPEVGLPALLPAAAVVVGAGVVLRRRRRVTR